MKQLQLRQIWIYPVKSFAGISLPSSRVRTKGLEYDRRWMLIDAAGMFMTQRTYPKMALFQTAINEDQLMITFENEQITVPLRPAEDELITIQSTVWEDPVEVKEADRTINNWFAKRLGVSCKLVFFPEKNARPVAPSYAINDEHVSLADGFPFLIIGEGSLNDLNSRMEMSLPMNRFRPNFVYSGGEPYEEDTWKNFTIGSTRFAGVKPCDRCVITTIDQDKGQKGVEPLKTLSSYRKRDNKIYFGQNAIATDQGIVSVGDEIILNDTSMH